jgi:dihydroxyacetone kinase-like protein
MKEVTKAIDQGAGLLYVYGNYSGDLINFDMAAEMSDLDGIAVKQVVGNGDVASSVVGEEHKRRGIAASSSSSRPRARRRWACRSTR